MEPKDLIELFAGLKLGDSSFGGFELGKELLVVAKDWLLFGGLRCFEDCGSGRLSLGGGGHG